MALCFVPGEITLVGIFFLISRIVQLCIVKDYAFLLSKKNDSASDRALIL